MNPSRDQSGRRFKGLVVVVPTRNRAEIARNAIESVLASHVPSVSVLVSDNSTDASEADQLARYCADIGDPRVRYVRPPSPCAMGAHWQWALEWALASYEVDHFAFLTDRMIFRAGELARLSELALAHPSEVISFGHEAIFDAGHPIYPQLLPWSGTLLRVGSAHLLDLTARSQPHPALPRMLNCVVPREVFELITSAFGDVFVAQSPDYAFCFRCLAVVPSVLYYDSMATVHYAQTRSNGASTTRGVASRDHHDFLAQIGSERINFAAPMPELWVVHNSVIHEYCVVQRSSVGARFPSVEIPAYLRRAAHEIRHTSDSENRRRTIELLRRHGIDVPDDGKSRDPLPDNAPRSKLGLAVRAFRTLGPLNAGLTISMSLLLRPPLRRIGLALARWYGVPPAVSVPCASIDEALGIVRNVRRRREDVTEAVRLALAGGAEIVRARVA